MFLRSFWAESCCKLSQQKDGIFQLSVLLRSSVSRVSQILRNSQVAIPNHRAFGDCGIDSNPIFDADGAATRLDLRSKALAIFLDLILVGVGREVSSDVNAFVSMGLVSPHFWESSIQHPAFSVGFDLVYYWPVFLMPFQTCSCITLRFFLKTHCSR